MNNTKDFEQYLKTSSTRTFKIMANLKEVKEIPAAQFDDSGMEKLDPEVISILSKAKKNG